MLQQAQYSQLLNEKLTLEKVAKGQKIPQPILQSDVDRLTKQIADFKEHCAWRPDDSSNQMEHPQSSQTQKSAGKHADINFSAQIPVSENLYQIPMKIVNHTNISTNSMQTVLAIGNNNLDNIKTIDRVVRANEPNGGGGGNGVVRNAGVINSVENFQLMQKPLADPSPVDRVKTSTAKISSQVSKTSEGGERGTFNAPNAPMPDQLKASSTTAASRKAEENFGR